MKQHGVAVDEGWSPPPRVVAAVRLLDLDHLGAHVAEDHAGHRSRDRLPDFDHPDAREWPGHCVSPLRSFGRSGDDQITGFHAIGTRRYFVPSFSTWPM